MKKMHWKGLVLSCVALGWMFSGCVQKQQVIKAEEEARVKHIIASVDGEYLTEGDLDRSAAWLPAFMRQLQSNASFTGERFSALKIIMIMAQDARSKGMLSEAERSLAIKEALANEAINKITYPAREAFTDEEIRAYQQAHPEEFIEPPAFTVEYALVKRESTLKPLAAAYVLSCGAQMGYNYLNPPERKVSSHNIIGPQMSNIDGHALDAKKFNYSFAATLSENNDESAQLGPFTASDNLLFSCDESIRILEKSPLNQPITRNLACSGDWKAFVIPEWRRDAAPMTEEKARQVAIKKLTSEYQEAYKKQYLENLVAESKQQ